MSYHPTNNLGVKTKEIDRENGIFSSKTPLRPTSNPLTSQLDWTFGLGQLDASYESCPGSKGLHWPPPPEPREVVRDHGLDEFCDTVAGSVSSDVVRSSRKYASSFNSNATRIATEARDLPGFKHPTSGELGPGIYEVPLEAVTVKDPKRSNYTFKSQTSSSIFGASSNEPPDNVQSINSAILNRHWTSKGSAFSTRERFPRVRAKWKD